MSGSASKESRIEDKINQHKFWKTQPVVKQSEVTEVGPIETRTLEEVRKDPYPLPKEYEWYDINVHDKEDVWIFTIFEFLIIEFFFKDGQDL